MTDQPAEGTASGPPVRGKIILRLLIGAVISALFLWRAFASIDARQVGEALRGASVGYVVLGLVPFVASWFLRALRWRALLPVGSPSPLRLYSFMLLGNLGNAVLPMRAGDIMRVFLVQTASALSFSGVLASIITEKLWDLLVICGYLVLAIVLLRNQALPSWVWYTMTGGAGVFALALTFVAGFVAAAAQTDRLVRWIGRKLPGGIGNRLGAAAMSFREGLVVAGRGRRLLATVVLSCAVWLLEAFNYVVWSRAVGVSLPPVGGVLVMTVANLSLLIPAAPGGVGTFDYACSGAIGLFHAGPQGLAAALLIHGAMYVTMVVLGLVCLLIESARLGASPFQALRGGAVPPAEHAAGTSNAGGVPQ